MYDSSLKTHIKKMHPELSPTSNDGPEVQENHRESTSADVTSINHENPEPNECEPQKL